MIFSTDFPEFYPGDLVEVELIPGEPFEAFVIRRKFTYEEAPTTNLWILAAKGTPHEQFGDTFEVTKLRMKLIMPGTHPPKGHES